MLLKLGVFTSRVIQSLTFLFFRRPRLVFFIPCFACPADFLFVTFILLARFALPLLAAGRHTIIFRSRYSKSQRLFFLLLSPASSSEPPLVS